MTSFGKIWHIVWKIIKWILLMAIGIFLLGLTIGLIYAFSRTPSLNRNWETDQAILPTADINGTKILIHNVRDFRYSATSTDVYPHYYDATYDTKDLTGMDFIVEPFSSIKAFAHTMFSFNFKDGRHVMVSVEIRKQKGDFYNALFGFFNKYELMYVVGDERDLLGARAVAKGVQLYMYPVVTTPDKVGELFTVLMDEVDQHAVKPEFYNTLYANCTTKLVDAVNVIAEPKIPWSWRYVAPGFSDEYAYSLGLIDTSVPFAELRQTHFISDLVSKYQNDPNFSAEIRQRMNGQMAGDYKNVVTTVDGQPAKYFGNEAFGDLNNDGVPDVGFIITQSGGGSGTFYYAAAALKTADGYQGTNAVLLGDRIAPQSTEIINGQLIVNYADRANGQPMTTAPSVGVSKYLEIKGGKLVSLTS